jgi:hypothetical protein
MCSRAWNSHVDGSGEYISIWISSNLTNNLLRSNSNGGQGGKDSDDVDLHLNGCLVVFGLVLELVEGGWKEV